MCVDIKLARVTEKGCKNLMAVLTGQDLMWQHLNC